MVAELLAVALEELARVVSGKPCSSGFSAVKLTLGGDVVPLIWSKVEAYQELPHTE